MLLPEQGHLLRIFVAESDKYDGIPLHVWIVRQAKEHGLAGATVIRGAEGFCGNSEIHTSKILTLANDMPIIIEVVDTLDKIDSFIPLVEHAIKKGLITVEDVSVRLYRNGNES
jgi:PII-like signaling protein